MKLNVKSGLGLVILLFFSTAIFCQKKAGIYSFTVTITKDLVTAYEVDRSDRTFFSGHSAGVYFTDTLSKKVIEMTEKTLSKKLNAEVECIYSTTKKGRRLETTDMTTDERASLPGLPLSTYKKAQTAHKKRLYISIIAEIKEDDKVKINWDLPGKKNKGIEPMIFMKIKAMDGKKDVVWENKTKIKGFASLKEQIKKRGAKTTRKAETLKASDVQGMYEKALAEICK